MTTSSSDERTTKPNGDGRTPNSGGGGAKSGKPKGRSAKSESAPSSTATTAPTASTADPAATDADAPGALAYAKIYPGIGFARVGNCPDQIFLAPEVPGRPADADGRFKDRQGRIKRQAARFRVYGFDADGNVLRELTAAEADITWTVHLANRKGAWAEFRGAAAEAQADAGGNPLPLRNSAISDRESLTIDPGPRSINGPSRHGVRVDGGRFLGRPVDLGELRTDDAGRLLVLGGAGRSESIDDSAVTDYANNDNWFDDTSDGPVTASVVLETGQQVPVTGSWVVVGPPDYAPAVGSIVTLHDVQVAAAKTAGWLPETEQVSFTHDVFPVLARAVGIRWVNDLARRGHGPGAAGDLLAPPILRRLASSSDKDRPARQRVFARLRNPELSGAEAVKQANLDYMPQLSGDEGFTTGGEPTTWFAVLPHQYAALRRWADGDFLADWAGVPPAPQSITQFPIAEQPAALDRAAGEACVGGPFFPGIEMTYTSRDAGLYAEPHRLRPDLKPGDVTKRMAVPWQADFYECRTRWWPAQRPDEVITQTEYESVLRALADEDDPNAPRTLQNLRLNTEAWDRGLGQDPNAGPAAGDNDMVTAWSQLGILRPRPLPSGGVALVEGERRPYFGMKDREYFHIMLNIESYPDFLPTARDLADRYLGAARDLQRSPACPDDLRPFTYSTRVLRSRLEQIYTAAAQSADSFSLADTQLTRAMLIERLVQMAPFNQVDGAWLRNVGRIGPIDEVHSLLFHVWMDELGNGDPKLNHSNIYTDLLHSVGIYLEPVSSRAYIENERIVDSAFTSPLFQLVIAEFSEDYLPEIIGMTLYLEWAVVAVKPQVAIMEALGIDPMFYSLHIGIDNSATGHGAMAKRTTELYLDEVRASGGDKAMQEAWSRIWDGYVAFATTGGLGEDFRRKVQQPPNPGQRVADMIRRKAHFGAQNHGATRIGDNTINNWFADPTGFMRELVRSGYIIPGDVDGSPFFELLRPTGPMFRVFTDDEIRVWENWTRSLADPTTPSEPETDVATLMVRMIDTLRARQQGTPGHDANQLTGTTPEGIVTEPVGRWFDRPTPVLLAALADPHNGWITPGDAASSRFVTELATGDHPMARVLGEVATGTAHKTWRTIAIDWIAAGCPLPTTPAALTTALETTALETTALETTALETTALETTTAGVDADGDHGKRLRPPVQTGGPTTSVTATLREDTRNQPQIPLLGIFQNQTWTDEFDHVPVYGNGALH